MAIVTGGQAVLLAHYAFGNMQAHLVQFDIIWEDKDANYAIVERMLESAPMARGDFVLLPEMFDTGFSLNVERTADEDGRSGAFLRRVAQRWGVFVQAGITRRDAQGRGLNRAACYGPDGASLCEYDKIHPFSFGRESERFVGGTRVVTYDWNAGDGSALRICPAMCYDLRFPELFRAGLSLGAELYALGANWPAAREHHWRALLVARAIENQAYVLGVNRCGSDPHLQYPGASLVVDPQGRIVADGGTGPGVVSAAIDPQAVRSWRAIFPAWRDRSAALGAGAGGRVSGSEGVGVKNVKTG